ncbi:MAG: ParB N-terminal domain-containing protein [Phycisphaerales bacterium]|nr:ParB N-terminal domain-containing protein [Phycisphaerales bacterium]
MKTRKRPTVRPEFVRLVSLSRIIPCPENKQLYRLVDPRDPDIQALAESIREHGVREPLVITEDGYLLSGHRRRVAAKLAGLTRVPCRIEPIRYGEASTDEIVQLLREHNRQRVKSLDEMLREEVVSADPDLAHVRLLEHRRDRSDMSDRPSSTVEMSGRKGRKRISEQKRAMTEAVMAAIGERREYWPLSDRQIHYVLLNDPPLRNVTRPDSRYANDRASYGDLCDLLTRARLTGEIVWRAIGDETRPTTQWRCHAHAQAFIHEQVDELFRNYARDLQRTQPNHIEIVAEKLTVRNIVERVASRFCLPVTIGRGYCSITPRYDMAQRFRRSGKERLIVLILSDFDPDGEAIAESFARSMRDDFDVVELVPVKVALTAEQVTRLGLRSGMQAKRGSAQYRKFARQHGTNVYELEAVPPDVLQQLLTEAIDAVLDVEALNGEIDAEKKDAAFLEEARQRACLALGEMRGEIT